MQDMENSYLTLADGRTHLLLAARVKDELDHLYRPIGVPKIA
jgi:hypothetical protein